MAVMLVSMSMLMPTAAFAQAVYGSILGTVTDPQGAAVAGAKALNAYTVETPDDALAAARALAKHSKLSAKELALEVAAAAVREAGGAALHRDRERGFRRRRAHAAQELAAGGNLPAAESARAIKSRANKFSGASAIAAS